MWICIARRLLRISNSAADWVALEDSTSGGLAGRISGIEFLNQFEEAILGLVDFRALEGPSIEALVIESNTIEGTNRSRYPSGAIRIEGDGATID